MLNMIDLSLMTAWIRGTPVANCGYICVAGAPLRFGFRGFETPGGRSLVAMAGRCRARDVTLIVNIYHV